MDLIKEEQNVFWRQSSEKRATAFKYKVEWLKTGWIFKGGQRIHRFNAYYRHYMNNIELHDREKKTYNCFKTEKECISHAVSIIRLEKIDEYLKSVNKQPKVHAKLKTCRIWNSNLNKYEERPERVWNPKTRKYEEQTIENMTWNTTTCKFEPNEKDKSEDIETIIINKPIVKIEPKVTKIIRLSGNDTETSSVCVKHDGDIVTVEIEPTDYRSIIYVYSS